MAIATKTTLLSLDQFAEVMQVSPLAINQLDINKLGVESDCDVWFQYAWQKGETINREALAHAISEAEHLIAENLGFWPAPRYTEAERINYPRPRPAEYWNIWYNERWKLKSVRAHFGKLWGMGIEAYGEIDDDAAITTSDEDGDGFADWFTAGPVPTGVINECEIGVYFRDADRPTGLVMDEESWRVSPVKVVISGGAVTVSGSLWLLVDPALLVTPTPTALDPTAAATFVTGVKIQRRYLDTTDQGYCSLEHVVCCGSQCSNIEVDACFGNRNAEAGLIIPEATDCSWPLGAPDCCSGNCYYAPDFASVNYLSGHALSLQDGMCRVDHLMAQIVARLAVTLLPDKLCAECSEAQVDYWRELPPDNELGLLSPDDASNPLGIRRGALWTWKRIQELNHNKKVGAIL